MDDWTSDGRYDNTKLQDKLTRTDITVDVHERETRFGPPVPCSGYTTTQVAPTQDPTSRFSPTSGAVLPSRAALANAHTRATRLEKKEEPRDPVQDDQRRSRLRRPDHAGEFACTVAKPQSRGGRQENHHQIVLSDSHDSDDSGENVVVADLQSVPLEGATGLASE